MNPSPGAGGPVVSLSGVAKRYRWGGPWVLAGIEAAVAAGAVVELKGANGSGKSTLLRLLAGASAPSRGTRFAADGLTVGYAPEGFAAPPLSAAAYLDHQVRLRGGWLGFEAAEAGCEIAALGERLECGSLLAERMATLSKGSLRKIALIQALLGAPRLLVLDEAFDGLDEEARARLRQILTERREGGAAIVQSSHRGEHDAGPPDAIWRLREGSLKEERS